MELFHVTSYFFCLIEVHLNEQYTYSLCVAKNTKITTKITQIVIIRKYYIQKLFNQFSTSSCIQDQVRSQAAKIINSETRLRNHFPEWATAVLVVVISLRCWFHCRPFIIGSFFFRSLSAAKLTWKFCLLFQLSKYIILQTGNWKPANITYL
ncbi:Hypothetical_protein [Hexamita inflata]|uniref:Hypothetical_protein n=1 Tax=Hexamita inflata TaxID=28002 RepID=A0AA86V284_9EUKA|nr:Hypothetical protein HINF_LOCUS65504 [Hexamita inflata]